jgi:predicted transcriptional regulator
MPFSADPLLPLAAQIVSAHVEHNVTPAQSLPGLIREVYKALASVDRRDAPEPMEQPTSTVRMTSAPARRATGRQTVFDDHLVCMECGLHMKMLKRHLQTVHGMSPGEYRAKFQLTGDYPMVARQYATLRSNLAKESGLGKRPLSRGR